MNQELRDVLLQAAAYKHLPSCEIPNAFPRIISALWRMAADDYLKAHPKAWDEAQLEEPTSDGVYYLTLIGEAHAWANHGCGFTDFVFPTFFGTKLKPIGEEEEE